MAQPQKYERRKDFAENASDQVDLQSINEELDRVAESVNAVIANVGELQKDDGSLANGIVNYDNLSAEAKKQLAPIPGKDGTPGKDGIVTSVSTAFTTISIVGKRTIKARPVLKDGVLSIELDVEA